MAHEQRLAGMAADSLIARATGIGPILVIVALLLASLQLMGDATEGSARFGELFVIRGLCCDAPGLGRLAQLVGRERAAELMTAMKRWLDEKRADAGGLSEEAIESFATWVEERSDMVAQVGTLASLGRSW